MKPKKKESASAPEEMFSKPWHPYAWIFGACFLLYARTLFFELVLLDDNLLMIDKQLFFSRWGSLIEVFKKSSFLEAAGGHYYRPIMLWTFIWDAHLGGLAVFHFSNIVFHGISAALLFSFFKKIKIPQGLAFCLTLVFAVHPVLAMAIAWMPGRTDSFLAIFMLASFNCFLDFLSEGRWKSLFLHFLWLALALLTKELAVFLPAACLAYVWLMNKNPLRPRHWLAGGGWIVLAGAWYLIRQAVLYVPGSQGGYSLPASFHSVYSNLPAVLVYIGKIILPVNLSTYPILQDAPLVYGGVGLAALAAALFFSKNKSWRTVLFGAGWFFIFLLPSFVYPKFSITPVFFEYRVYLPLIGFLIVLAEIDWIKSFSLRNERSSIVFLALILSLSAVSWVNSGNYQNSLACWQSAVKHSPSSAFAHKQLGTVHYFNKNYAQAEIEDRKALELNPNEPMVHNNIGVIYMNSGRLAEAEAEYKMELSINPNYDNALFNLGLIYFNQGRRPEAAALWERTLSVAPDYLDAHRNLAIYYYGTGDFAKALAHGQEIIGRGGQVPPELWRALAPYRK